MSLPLVVVMACLSAACGGMPSHAVSRGAAQAAAQTVAGNPANTMQIPEQLVIEGSMSVRVTEIADVVPALRGVVESSGGRIINEVVSGAETSWNAQLKIRLPPDKVEEVVGFLAKRGEIVDKRITATDVSKQLFDQDIALKNLRTTMDRLTQLMAQGGLKVAEILEIEKELTRLRGQIEQIEGEQRFLKDRVSFATIDISMTRRAGAVTVAQAKLYPGGRFAALVLLGPDGRKRVRVGGGIVVHSLLRANSFELDIFQKERNADGTDASNAVIATTGGAAYSDFLGKGQRRMLNPYIGGRIGYGYLDGHKFVVQGEGGVELFKARNAVIDTNLRVTGLIGEKSDVALVIGGGATFAF